MVSIRINIRKQYSKNNVIKNNILISVALAPVIFLLVNRYMVGTDYYHYERMYIDYVKYNYINFEYGIAALIKISNEIGWGFKGFLFLCSIIGPFLSIAAIKRQCNLKYFPIAVLTYLIIFFGPACNIMAQVMAISFVILSIEQMLKKKWIFSIILCIIGSLFHIATLVMIPAYCAYSLEKKKKVKFASISIIILVGLFAFSPNMLSEILNWIGLGRYGNYIKDDKINTFLYLLIYRLPLILLELLYYRNIIKDSEYYQFYYFLIVLEIASCFLGIGIAWAGRLAYFFSITHVFLVAKILEVTKNSNERLIVKIIIIAYLIIEFYMMHFFSEFDGIVKYQFI